MQRIAPALATTAAFFVCSVVATVVAASPATTRPAATVDAPLPAPGMGWSTYNFFVARHDDRLMRQMGEAFVKSGLRDAGYTILRIDGGWWGDDGNRRWWYWTESGRYEGGQPYVPGDPHVDPRNYPGGIRPLADALHAEGLKLGFYLSPSISTGKPDNHPGNKEPKVQPPASGLALVGQHAKWAADGGIDHLFYDGYDWNKEQGTGPYTAMYQSLRKQARRADRPIAFSINSGWLARPRDWADEWRTGRDIDGKWPTILECAATVADPAPAGRGRWNNPDYLMVGFLGDEEAKSQMSLWCAAAAPLYTSWDWRVMNDWERYVLLNTEAIAVDQDPAGTPGRRIRGDAAAQVWARPLADGSRAVVLLNAGDRPADVAVEWAKIDLPAGRARVRDLWAHRTLGAFEDGYTAKALPPHGCAFLRVTPGERDAGKAREPAATWAPEPRRARFMPLDAKGWAISTNLPRKDDPVANLLDRDAKSGFWSWASRGQYVQLDFGKPTRFDRVVIDHKGAGPNPWPYHVYAPRSTFTLEVSDDGGTFRQVAADSFGPAYTIASFPPVTARFLRLVMRELERTSAYGDDPTFHAKAVYVFDTAGAAGGER